MNWRTPVVRRAAIGLALLAWVAAVGAGMKWMYDYANTSGPNELPPSRWPKESRIQHSSQRPTLVMFVHPRCPCSRASLEELNRFMVCADGRVAVELIFVKPPGSSSNWTDTDLWQTGRSIPGVHVGTDDGSEANRFHVETSGSTLLYDAAGELVFHGGITLSRGHAGDNPGLNTLEAFMAGHFGGSSSTPVFGCSLQSGETRTLSRSQECQ